MTQIDTSQRRGPSTKSMTALIAHNLSIGIMGDVGDLKAFCRVLMTAWPLYFSRHNSGRNPGSRSRYSWVRLHQCQLHQSESVQHYTKPVIIVRAVRKKKKAEKWYINVSQYALCQYFQTFFFILIGKYFPPGVKPSIYLTYCICGLGVKTLPCWTEYAWRGPPCGRRQSLHCHPRVPTEHGHWLLEDGVSGEHARHRHDNKGGGARTGEQLSPNVLQI